MAEPGKPEFSRGTGNGGRSCVGCSCLILFLSGVVLLLAYLLPLATGYAITPGDMGRPYLDSCSWLCCCFGSGMLILGLVLVFVDEGPPIEQGGAGSKKPKRPPKPKKKKKGKK